MKKEPPGNLKLVDKSLWLDIVFKSKLSHRQKLICSIIEKTCGYDRRDQCYFSDISDYDISRRIHDKPELVKDEIDELVANGWLWYTGINRGSKRIYALSFDTIAKSLYK